MATTAEPDDGVLASAAPVRAHTLAELEEAIVGKLDELADLLPENGTEDPDSALARARREAIEMQVADLLSREADKVDSIARVLRRLEYTAEQCKAESDALRKRSKTFEGKRERLAGYILDTMRKWGAKKLEGTTATLTRIQNSDVVEVDDSKALPFPLQRWTFSFEPRTEAELAELHDLLSRMTGRYDVAADKAAVRNVIQSAEKLTAEALAGTVAPAASAEDIPPGVRLKPGTWRLAVR